MEERDRCGRVLENLLERLSIKGDAPIWTLSVKQLFHFCWYAAISATQDDNKGTPVQEPERQFVYGLRGIQRLFGVSHKTAQAWKNTWLAPACSQLGRVIMVDRDKAIELFEATGRTKLGNYGC